MQSDNAYLTNEQTSPGMAVTTSHQVQGLKLLDGKIALIYGAAGGVGTAAAKSFGREGAKIFRTGRTERPLNLIPQEIPTTGEVGEDSKAKALSPDRVKR